MKIVRDNICYVDFSSLVNRGLAKYMDSDEKESHSLDDIITITNHKGIKVIKDRDDILDYDEVKDLTDEELNSKVKKVEDDLEPFVTKWLKAPYGERDKLYKDKEFKAHYDRLIDYYYELVDYRANRDARDDRIAYFLSGKHKVKKL